MCLLSFLAEKVHLQRAHAYTQRGGAFNQKKNDPTKEPAKKPQYTDLSQEDDAVVVVSIRTSTMRLSDHFAILHTSQVEH